MKISNSKKIKNLSIIAAAILSCLVIFLSTYAIFIHKTNSYYVGKVKIEIDKINEVNSASNIFIKDKSIDEAKVTESIPSTIKKLQSSQASIKELQAAGKYKDDQDNLLLGLENNISIYKQILKIVKNKENPNLDNLITQLKQYRDECMDHYALVSIKNVNLKLPHESLELVSGTITYAEEQIVKNTDAKIKASQNQNFLLSFNEILDEFNKIKKNYTGDIVSARNSLSGFDNLLMKIENIEVKVDEVRNKLSNLSVPEDAQELCELFTNVLDQYDIYLQNLKYAVKTESLTSVSGVSDNKSFDSLYSTPQNQIKVVENTYTDFIKAYTRFKNEII